MHNLGPLGRQMRERGSANAERIPIGIVGAGRSRNGCGPFLASFFEKEGFLVRGVSGRSPEGASANAEMLGQRLGHELNPFASPAELCASGVAALVIASPAEFHLEAMREAARPRKPRQGRRKSHWSFRS
jgi:predicted dehydrogenase